MTGSDQPTQQQIDDAYRKALDAYGDRPDVTGVDVGYRYTNGQRTNDVVVRVHVLEKLHEAEVAAAEVLPREIDGVPVDVIEAAYRPSEASGPRRTGTRRDRSDPIRPGVSISRQGVGIGTFGMLVYDQRTGRPCVLSNWHVLVDSETPENPILQPGWGDGGRSPGDTIGRVARKVLDQDGDAAIAVLDGPRAARAEQWGSEVLIEGVRAPRVGEILEKSGRATDVTRGRVDGVGQYTIPYSVGPVSIDGFKVVAVDDGNPNDEEISGPGDSGAVWYGAGDRIGVGLHFAGEMNPDPTKEHSLACYLQRVLARMEVSLSPPA